MLNRLLRSPTAVCVITHLLQQELVLVPVLNALQVLPANINHILQPCQSMYIPHEIVFDGVMM